MSAQCDRLAGPLSYAHRPAFTGAHVMMQPTLLRSEGLPGFADVVMAAARCWRAARDCGAPVQQRLYALLSGRGYDMLAPVFDSLMTLYEATLGRRISTGQMEPSRDESLLLELLDGSRPRRGTIDCMEGPAVSLDCAIMSTRLMVTLAGTENRNAERSATPLAALPPVLAAGTA